ncbi:MAG TPA: Hsp70 family protein [Pyrinomonadaceae bacterium]|jgi:molecular chaperone DnaK
MSDYHKVIGIDLGTTFSVVAVYVLGKSEVLVIPNPHNQRTTPSIVYIGKNGQISVGDAARQKIARDPEGVVIEAKRLMGEREPGGGKQMIRAGGREFEPEFISACILRELKGYAETYIGEPIHDAVITVPAYFKEPQKNATREAARLARLNPRLIVNEPTAAAVAYGLDEDEDSTFIVYDFGGGTFDVSVVRVKNGREFDILGTGGDSHLGGGDIDRLIIDWALANMRRDFGQDFGGDAKLVGRLRIEAERLKINLCSQNAEQELYLENPTKGVEQIQYYLGPREFKKLLEPILERTAREVEVAMESAAKRHGLGFDDVDAFVLVGGSSKIPYVREMLGERFKKPIKSDLNPDEIVAIGAARLAVDYPPSQGAVLVEDAPLVLDKEAPAPEGIIDTQIKDVVSHTLGIGLKNDVYDPLIEKDKYIPHKVTRKGYTTAEDNQTSIFIPVYQGDNPKASLNYQLGEAVIDGLTPAPVGTHRFEVTFALDADGIFFGEVFHQQTGERKTIKLQRGQDTLVAKRRVELADAVERGFVTMEGAPAPADAADSPEAAPQGDKITELIQEAQRRLGSLPFAAQGELTEALAQLVLAKASNNLQEQGLAVLKITSVLNAHKDA